MFMSLATANMKMWGFLDSVRLRTAFLPLHKVSKDKHRDVGSTSDGGGLQAESLSWHPPPTLPAISHPPTLPAIPHSGWLHKSHTSLFPPRGWQTQSVAMETTVKRWKWR